ncbi:polysaccharide biosynthesis/export family protein [Thalassovita aquimarina]|uniref:Polysaccharide biosynthesis/export family protein n=1 Tax=Thalassovita aquimarina TaxID=2785917 RepID=A0ABS5HNS0_9RHOB|nr:polysaccharide biosynthesis/export family protein [Thalassovita aquimarina]MBR9650253.1 polysaccharide biosynthesis/export family protein [Thalassovita aquimarina]
MTTPIRSATTWRLPKPGNPIAALRLLLVALLTLLAAPVMAGAEEYRLAPGDVLHVLVVGAPDLSIDVPIEMNGAAWFPLVGAIEANGKTLDEVRRETAEAYAAMSLSRRVAPGGGLPQVIETNQVLVTVVAYRPIYVSGDAVGVREIPFRSGMTLHHVTALTSGGPPRDTQRPASSDEIAAAATALANEYARIWRLKSFLGTDTPKDYERIFVAHVPAIDSIVSVERSILTETRAAIRTQKLQLRDEIARVRKRIAVLSQQKQNEDDGLAIDEKYLEDVRALHEKGLAALSRVAEVRRAALVTASRALQIDVALEDARAEAAKLAAELSAVDSDARISAWKDLGEAVARAQQRQASLAALSASAGETLRQLYGIKPTAKVTRDGVTLGPAETTPSLALMPGDIVEFHLLPPGMAVTSEEQRAETQ